MPTKINKLPVGHLEATYFGCIELWQIGFGFYQLVEIGPGRTPRPFGKVFAAAPKDARKQAYDIACVESDCRHDLSD